MVKKIKVGNSYALVDEDDLILLSGKKWRLNYNGYAFRRKHIQVINGKQITKKIYMHRLIMNTPIGFDTDHINRNKLDNRKNNLRIVTRSLNNFNSKPSVVNTSGTKGVYWFKPISRWRSYIGLNNKRIGLGYFNNKNDAINARKKAEKKYVLFT